MEAAGMSDRMVAQILGHSSVQITHGYQHGEEKRMRAGLNDVERLLGGPKELGD
jgi:site-specific recombinase XerD